MPQATLRLAPPAAQGDGQMLEGCTPSSARAAERYRAHHRIGVRLANTPKFISRCLGALVVVLAVACAAPQAAAPKPATLDVRIGLIPTSATSPILVALDSGAFSARGLDVSLQTVTDTAQAMLSVAGGQLDVGNITLGAAALNAFNRGTNLKIIAAGGADPPGHGAFAPLVVRRELMDSGAVKTVADLKGRKVALNGRGVILDYDLAKLLATANLKPSDVEVVTMPWPEMVVALSTGALDAGLIGQPTAAQAVAKGVGRILSDDYNQSTQNAVLVANSRFLDQHRDAMADFLEVYIQSIRRLSDGKFKTDEQALAILQKYTNTPPEVTRLAPDPYWPKDGHIKMDSLVDQQAYFMSTKSVDYIEPMDLHQLIDYGPLDAALTKTGG